MVALCRLQIDKLQKAADDARQQLDTKENIVKELSRDGSKLDKERSVTLLVLYLVPGQISLFSQMPHLSPWHACMYTQ